MPNPIEDLFSLKEKVALVTGGRKGLGFEIARVLGQAGARVFISGRSSSEVEAPVQTLCGEGLDAEICPFNLGDPAEADRAVAFILERAGALHVLVNNIGKRHRAVLEKIDHHILSDMLNVNLVAVYAASRAAIAAMRPQKWGRIINLSTTSAIRGIKGDPAYIASKGGVSALTRALAAEAGADNITINDILPGPFATETNARMVQAAEEDPRKNIVARRAPLGRWGQPREIAGAALFLASDAGAYVTGQMLIVDGGISSQLY
ncbi:SDR family NAD(P)-dependent oxidoreductase [Sphingobium sp. TKS]|uniref:SDR family NAD(P)-dependent oxidoreductase n=1 Tax=Sphingobium sp. TKS TaxID=1315974 RepID=UPI0007704DBA|nr:SDR family oxidoreductase [Sphingobium sp. TKS]AMK25611.1 Dehydrogenase [Sphingobium sp. TKS]